MQIVGNADCRRDEMQIVVQILVMVRLWNRLYLIPVIRCSEGLPYGARARRPGLMRRLVVACSAINMNFAAGAAYNYSYFVTSDDIPLDEDYFEVVDSEVSNGSVD
ncbi:hypothetical protein WN943_003526 [Citrus x changshan-huyou]